MSTIWFTSDTHYGHGRVIEYSRRPYDDADEMDEALITNWNSVVRPGDLVYHLGDFSFHRLEKSVRIAKRLAGQKYLVLGNHDKRMRRERELMSQFVWARDLEQIDVDGQKIVLCHYAMLTWNQSHRGSWQLHGHSHGSLSEHPGALRLDVGVDPQKYYPVSFEQVREVMARKKFEPVDHHGQREFEK